MNDCYPGGSLFASFTFLMKFALPLSSARMALRSLIFMGILNGPSLQKPLAAEDDSGGHHGNTGLIQCGDYSNQVLPNGRCKIVATLPQMDEQRCPDMFRCTDEVSYWLHENEERKQQILELRELISELQEELRNHRHRIKVLELQHEEKNSRNSTVEQRVQELEQHYNEASTLQHIQATLLYDMQAQIHNISLLTEWVRRNPGCLVPAEMRSLQEMHHPDVKHAKNCPIDCASIYYNGIRRSGVYSIMPSVGGMPIEVLCEMDTEGGGWTVIQRRQDGSVNFTQTWNEYKDGFGDLNSEFWLGNENIHKVTNQGDYSLRIDLEDWNNKHKHAFYQIFSIEDEANDYRLHVDGFSGTVEDSFAWYHNKRSFSTPDTGNICAEISHGGWWYHQCFFSNLNGVYYKGGRYSTKNRKILGPDGIVWYTWKDSDYYSLKKVTMMIRPRTFRPHLSP
ncbi:angiopoietin-related protein 7-like [Gopherus evgoodei]|uniref:angiopoietin-related protein 7-like n=1 Tax=Gopherus evgoodei TaxID=1825980 RepID=UPI0011CFDECD|nr:angiopoietin-related protein 7-like [Gopherus evgoodei]